MSDAASHRLRSTLADAEPGDWLEVHRVGGGPPRLGQILEIIDRDTVPHFRVRWSEESETLHFPAEGDRLLKKDAMFHTVAGGRVEP